MSEKPFRIIYNLEELSAEQREQYKRDVSEFFGLDPNTNWFDILWILDEATGLRKLQLYARRGTTDVLRGKRGISITSLTQHDGPGYVSFTAVGKDENGRQEIAVGSHSIEGLKGEKLAAAVMTAETRAGRRLTLKFCGLGILDYSEVNQDVPISAQASGAELAPSSVPPVYSLPASLPLPQQAAKIDDAVAQGLAEAEEIGRQARAKLAEIATPAQSPEEFSRSQQALRDEAKHQLEAKSRFYPGDAAGALEAAVDDLHSVAQNPPAQGVSTNETPEQVAPKTRKPRKKKNTVELSDSAQPATAPTEEGAAATATGIIPPPAEITTPPLTHPASPVAAPQMVVPTTVTFPVAQSQAYQPTLAPPAPVVVDFPGKPTKEQEEKYRDFFREYANNILPSSGMMPSENIGGASAKLRLFAQKITGKQPNEMTVTDWEDFMSFFPGFLKDNSPKNLVKYINDVIGAK